MALDPTVPFVLLPFAPVISSIRVNKRTFGTFVRTFKLLSAA